MRITTQGNPCSHYREWVCSVGGFENMWATLQTLVYIHKLLVATSDDTCVAFYPYNKRNIRCQLRTG